MAYDLLHLVFAAGWIFRTEHVCGCGGGELPQMQRRIGSRDEGESQEEENGAKTAKDVHQTGTAGEKTPKKLVDTVELGRRQDAWR